MLVQQYVLPLNISLGVCRVCVLGVGVADHVPKFIHSHRASPQPPTLIPLQGPIENLFDHVANPAVSCGRCV